MDRAFLTALAQHPEGLTKGEVLIHAGYASSGPTSSTFANLNANGWMEQTAGGKFTATPSGLTALGSFDPLPVGRELRRHVLDGHKLNTMEKRFMAVLFDAYPEAVGKGQILEASEYASSGPTSSAFARLVKLGYAKPHGRSTLRASDNFFES